MSNVQKVCKNDKYTSNKNSQTLTEIYSALVYVTFVILQDIKMKCINFYVHM